MFIENSSSLTEEGMIPMALTGPLHVTPIYDLPSEDFMGNSRKSIASTFRYVILDPKSDFQRGMRGEQTQLLDQSSLHSLRFDYSVPHGIFVWSGKAEREGMYPGGR